MTGRSVARGKGVLQGLFLVAGVWLIAAGCGGELVIDSEQSALERFASQLENGNYKEACQELEDLCNVTGFACSANDLFCEGAEHSREGICERMSSACQEQGVGCETHARHCVAEQQLNGGLCDDDVFEENGRCGEGEEDQQGCCNSAVCFEEDGRCGEGEEDQQGCCNSGVCFEEDGSCECQGDCNYVEEQPQQLVGDCCELLAACMRSGDDPTRSCQHEVLVCQMQFQLDGSLQEPALIYEKLCSWEESQKNS